MNYSGIRPMLEVDLDEVLELEEITYEFPWTQGIFEDCLRNQYNSILYVKQKKIIAYLISQFIVNECHLLNLCVIQSERRSGLGEKMVHYLLNQTRQNNIESIFLEVRISNTAALQLYEKLGFNEVGLRRDYYPNTNGREDALVLAYEVV